jgi:hypothetical protein
VVRNGFGRELAARLVEHLGQAIEALEAEGGTARERPAFHH